MENCYAFKLLWVLVYAIGCDEIKEEWSFFENTLSKSSLKTDPLKHICPLIEDTKLNSSLVNKSLFSFWYSVAYPLSQYWNDCRHRHFKKLDHTRRWLHIYGTIGIWSCTSFCVFWIRYCHPHTQCIFNCAIYCMPVYCPKVKKKITAFFSY